MPYDRSVVHPVWLHVVLRTFTMSSLSRVRRRAPPSHRGYRTIVACCSCRAHNSCWRHPSSHPPRDRHSAPPWWYRPCHTTAACCSHCCGTGLPLDDAHHPVLRVIGTALRLPTGVAVRRMLATTAVATHPADNIHHPVLRVLSKERHPPTGHRPCRTTVACCNRCGHTSCASCEGRAPSRPPRARRSAPPWWYRPSRCRLFLQPQRCGHTSFVYLVDSHRALLLVLGTALSLPTRCAVR